MTPETASAEHLIPNSIGGRKKVAGILCRSCNSKAGFSWDAELAKQLNPISLLLGVSRERGEPQAQAFETTGGSRLVLRPDGGLEQSNPTLARSPVGSGERIAITARSMEEAKRMVSGLVRKHPKLDFDQVLKGAVSESRYPKDLLKMRLEFGGPVAGRSIVKTALAIAAAAGIRSTIAKRPASI